MSEDVPSNPQMPRYLSLVRFNYEELPVSYHDKYPFMAGRSYVFFGEIPNMPGHCVVADHQTGQIFSGYHAENFQEIPEEEA